MESSFKSKLKFKVEFGCTFGIVGTWKALGEWR
jgi:hypothetical protein